MTVVYDGTAPVAHERVLGPGKPVVHAFPDGSRVALCGAKRAADPRVRPSADRCPQCVNEAGRKNWVAR